MKALFDTEHTVLSMHIGARIALEDPDPNKKIIQTL